MPRGVKRSGHAKTRAPFHAQLSAFHRGLSSGALPAGGAQDFTSLVKRFEVADGAMAMHLRKLEDAGYIACKRRFVGRRPKSTCSITAVGRKALRQYLATMQRIIDLAAEKK